MAKLSQWHGRNVNPVHVGVYERQDRDYANNFSFWNGKFWVICAKTIKDAVDNANYLSNLKSCDQKCKWRGIVK